MDYICIQGIFFQDFVKGSLGLSDREISGLKS